MEMFDLLDEITKELQDILYQLKKAAELSTNKVTRERLLSRASGIHQSIVLIKKKISICV